MVPDATVHLLVDFEQPRALWSKVWNDQQREAYVKNVSGHLGNVRSDEIKARQREFHIMGLILRACG